MILLLTIFAIVAILLICGAVFLKGKVKKVSIVLSLLFICIPISFIAFLGVFKTGIQQGKLLSSFGPILILIAPPDDLWVPLGKEDLAQDKEEYHFKFVHKYVGKHVVDLSFKEITVMEMAENNFEIEYVVTNGEKVIFSQKSNKGRPYWGQKDCGLSFISYHVPQELPVNTVLFATLIVKGDISSFINKYGPTRLSIRKGSDE